MARRTDVGGHYHHQQDSAALVSDAVEMVGSDTETLERLFPKCRVKSLDKSPVETDSISPTVLSKSVSNMDTAPQPETCPPTNVTSGPPLNPQPQSYGVTSTSRRRSHHNVMYRREYLKSTEHRRRPRPKTLDIPTPYYDSQAGYDPSPDSDEGFPDEPECYVASNSNVKTSHPNCPRDEPLATAAPKDQHLRHHKVHKEVFQIANPLASSQPNQDSRIEMAGGREVVSRSRAKAATKKRQVSHLGLHLVNASGVVTPCSTQQPSACHPSPCTTPVSIVGTPSSAARNRYSGEVYYEESLGRYGFHVDGNTLWGNRGLEPNFIDLDDKDDGSSGKFASPLTDSSNKSQTGGGRPLSWSGAENLVMSARPVADETPTTGLVPSTPLAGSQARPPLSPTENEKEEPAALSESEYTALIQMGGYLTDLYADLQQDPLPSVGNRANSNSLGLPAVGSVSSTAADTSHIEDLLLLDFTPTPQLPYQPEDKTSPCLIGGIPIAQYDGSPRRYGPRPPFSHDTARELVSCKNLANYLPHHGSSNSISSNSNKTNGQSASLPRPGFPRRVTPEDVTLSNAPVTFAPSQTRQTLEELCTLASKPEDEDSTPQTTEEKLSVSADLDYILRRQFGNAYVASRLAQRNGLAAEDTGGLHGNEPVGDSSNTSQGFLGSSDAGELLDSPAVDAGNECDRDTASTEDLGETEVGLVVGQSRNFTLSPETTDCDSELESPPSDRLSVGLNGEAELDPPQHRSSAVAHLKPHPRAFYDPDGGVGGQPVVMPDQNQLDNQRDNRRFGSMPVLEDGLSSGHNSDVEVGGGAGLPKTGADAGPLSDEKRPSRLSNTVSGWRNGTPTVSHSLRHTHMGCTPPAQNGSVLYDKTSSLIGLSHQTLPSGTEALMSPISPQSAPTPSRLPSRTYILPAQSSSAGWCKKNYSNNNYQGPLAAKPDYQRQVEHFLRSQNIPSYTNISQTNSDVDGLDSLRSQENESPPPPPAPRSLSPAECNQNHSSQEQLHHSQSAQQLVDLGSRVPSTGSSKGPVNAKADNVAIQELRDALRQTRNRHSLKIPAAVSTTQQQSAVTDTVSASPVWIPRLGSSAGSHGDQWKSSSKANGNHEDGEDEEQKETDELLAEDEHPPDSEFFDEKDRIRTVNNNRRRSSTLPSSSVSASSATPSSAASTSKSSPSASNHTALNSASIVAVPAAAGDSGRDKATSLADEGRTSPCNNAELAPPKHVQEESSITGKKKGRTKEVMVHEPAVLIEGVLFRAHYLGSTQLVCEGAPTKITRMMQAEEAVSRIKFSTSGGMNNNDEPAPNEEEEEEDLNRVVQRSYLGDSLENNNVGIIENVLSSSPEIIVLGTPSRKINYLSERVVEHRGAGFDEPEDGEGLELDEEEEEETEDNLLPWTEHESYLTHDVINGCTFRLRYYGAMEISETDEGETKYRSKKTMVEEAVTRLKALAPEGETQPSTEVDLFISTEKIMVLNTDLKEIMMDHALRTISYIADIGDLVVLMARRRVMPQDGEQGPQICPTPKMICHVFESEEAQFIAQSIGQAFQVAYMEFLKANGIEDQSFVREMDYQEVLNSQEIFGDELQMFAKKELQKEVIVPKARGEILGMVIVESGWGSMLPTVVIANLSPAGAAARCGQLNIGDQIIAINGVSLVGLPLSTCQGYIKNAKSSTAVKLTVVPCPPVVEVKIKRPDTKYQLGFSVQNGVICSLLRGGIAERGGVRVGHRIIEINGQSVVAVPHERIVGLLATSVGEIHMKTMPTSMFRLLTGQETPVYL